MKIFADTEFNGFGGDLISIGCVAENGAEFYEVAPYSLSKLDPFVLENVIPNLDKQPADIENIVYCLHKYIECFEVPNVYVIANYWEDLYHVRSLIDCWRTDTKVHYRITPVQTKSARHNALEDARALKEMCGF